MVINLDVGPFLSIPDKLNPGQYYVVKNPDWNGCLPDIVTFTEFLKWNYTLDYGRFIRGMHRYGMLPMPWGIPQKATIENVVILNGFYDRIDHSSFNMHVICEVYFSLNGFHWCQQYVIYGKYVSGGRSNFFTEIDLYDGKYIRLKNPLDSCLVPILRKRQFKEIAKEMLEEFYPYEITAPCWINAYALAKSMGLDEVLYEMEV